MAALNQLLERLRRVRLPPGAAAGAVAVPSPGAALSDELAPLFADLDLIEHRSASVIAAAHADAADIEASAARERSRLLERASADADRLAAGVLSERRASCDEHARAMLADAGREADRVVARGRERTGKLVDEVIRRMLEGAG